MLRQLTDYVSNWRTVRRPNKSSYMMKMVLNDVPAIVWAAVVLSSIMPNVRMRIAELIVIAKLTSFTPSTIFMLSVGGCACVRGQNARLEAWC